MHQDIITQFVARRLPSWKEIFHRQDEPFLELGGDDFMTEILPAQACHFGSESKGKG